MATITKTMKQDALDTARGYIERIGNARDRGEANWLMGKAHGLLDFAQVWSLIDVATVKAMHDQATMAYRNRARYLKGGVA